MRNRKLFTKISLSLLIFFFLLYSAHKIVSLHKKKTFLNEFKKAVSEKLDNKKIDYSFAITDLRFPVFHLTLQSEEDFPAASLVKLPILAVLFKAHQEGKVDLDQKVIIKRKDITGGSGKIKAMSLPHETTLRELAKLMITISDNTATNKIIDILGFDYINQQFKEIGLKNTILKRKMMDFSSRRKGIENYINSRDIVYLLKKIYNGNLINKEYSKIALEFLKEQKVNDRLPRYLPEGVVVAHKTGLERGIVHDAGIVLTPKGDYVICALLKGIKSYRKAKKIIAEISLLTYNLYQ